MVILVAQCFIQPSQSSGAVTSSLSLLTPTSFVRVIWKANLRWHLSGVSLFRIYRGRQSSYVWCRELC